MINIRRRRDFRRWQHRIHRVYLNGVDVTKDCWKVDVRRGRVWLFVRGLDGRIECLPPRLTYRRNHRTGETEERIRPLQPRTAVRLGKVRVVALPPEHRRITAVDVRRWFRIPRTLAGKRSRRAVYAFNRRLNSRRLSIRIKAEDSFTTALRRVIGRLSDMAAAEVSS